MSNTTEEVQYRPACRATKPGGCADCNLAYDCQAKRDGRISPFLVLAVVIGVATLVLML